MMTYTGRIDHDDPYNKNIHMYNTKNLVKQSSCWSFDVMKNRLEISFNVLITV